MRPHRRAWWSRLTTTERILAFAAIAPWVAVLAVAAYWWLSR